MDERTMRLVEKLHLRSGASRSAIEEVRIALGLNDENGYLEFLSESNGYEGSVGNSYLQLWSVEELESLNEGYHVKENTPGLVYIGSDGGGEAYAIDTRDGKMEFVQLPFIGIDFEGLIFCGKSFAEFLENLYSRYP